MKSPGMNLCRHPRSADQFTTVKPGPRLPGRYGEANRSAALIALAALLLTGCATTQAPLKPEHGYPADWPRLLPLSEGFTELNGVYSNEGVATTVDGALVPIKLADLVPRATRRKGARPEPESGCEDCVALRVLPADGSFPSANRLRFTAPHDSGRSVFDVDVAGTANSALYPLVGSGQSAIVGMAVSSTEVWLTCAEDGSLVAQIHSTGGMLLLMVIPITSQNDYVWARFERIGDLRQSPTATTTPPAYP
jgi:hypothetical protein